MNDTNPNLKAQFKAAIAQALPEPVSLSLENSYLCGPFENRDLIGVTTVYPPETDPTLTAVYQGKTGTLSWLRAPVLDGAHDLPLNFNDLLAPGADSVVYLSTELRIPAPVAAQISLQCPAIVKVWLDGALLISSAIPEEANPEDSSAWVGLSAGTHRMLVKILYVGAYESRIALRVQSFGPFDAAIHSLRVLAACQEKPGIRLTSKVTLAELLGVSGDEPGTRAALLDIRQDPYATRWDVAWVEALERQFEKSGQFAPFHDPAVAYQPVTSVQPYPEYWPQSPAAARELLVVDVSQASASVEFAMSVLQGLVNRSRPRLYLLHTRYERQDRMWLDELHLEGYTSRQVSIEEAWAMFVPETKGAVLYDGSIMDEIGAFHSDRLNQTNLIMMICALQDALPLTPEMNQALALPVIFDARGKWSDQYDMMRWAYVELFPRMNQRLIATQYPGIFLITDYLVSFKIFTFWFPQYRTTIEENLLRGMLASTPPNTPILGWWFDWMPTPQDPNHLDADAVMEGPGVVHGSFFGKFLTPSHEAANLTVHSGVPLAGSTHKAPARPVYDPSKIYYTFMISDGDNMGEALMLRTRDIQWDKPERGAFPMGWSFAPATSHLAPPVLNYYLRTASPNDVLMGGLGVAYTEPRVYLRAFPDQFEELWDAYARATDTALSWIDSTVLWLINGRHEEADRYARGAHGHLRGIFIGYGGSPEIAEARITYNQVVAFYPATRTHWADNSATEKRIQAMVDEIRAGVRQSPDFIEAWVLNWGLDMSMLLEVQKRLGPTFVCVRPDVLTELRLQAG